MVNFMVWRPSPGVAAVRLAECLLNVQQFSVRREDGYHEAAVIASDARHSHSGRGLGLSEN
ncbi:MAG TPA: hypothetical protein VJK90_07655, partial [Acetobacteraceae bacterium]|nr:hypothetical protein [Acetobacteraceae bacterium]